MKNAPDTTSLVNVRPLLDHVAGGRLQFALARLLEELRLACPEAASVLHDRYGVGYATASDVLLRPTVAMSAEEVWELESEALEMLGFLLVTEVF